MSFVTDQDRAQAVADVRDVITAFGTQAMVYREPATLPDSERLYGVDDEAFVPVGDDLISVEFVTDPPTDIAQKVDAYANVFPDADVLPEDRLEIEGTGELYRVQAVKQENWFGAITHLHLSLVALHEDSTHAVD